MTRATALAALAAAAVVAVASTSARSATPLLAGTGTATVDGLMGPGEWTHAAKADFNVTGSPGWAAAGVGSLLVMNDSANLYVGVMIPGIQPPASTVSFNFDGDADGVLREADDAILLNPSFGYYDEYYTMKPPCPGSASACLGIFDTDTGGSSDGSGQMRNNGSFSFFELSHPLNSADDAHDFSLNAGDVIAISPLSGFRECDGQTCVDSSFSTSPLQILVTPFVQPTISSFTPTHAMVGTPVTLTGAHFTAATSVRFGGVSAEFEVASTGSIATAVPAGAKSGPITVTTPGGTGTSTSNFVVDVPHPFIAPPTTSPLRAGHYATVRFTVTRSDTGAALTQGKMVCDPSVSGKVLAHSERFAGGTASLRFLIPASAKGKLLRVRLTIRWQGTSATRTSSFRVR